MGEQRNLTGENVEELRDRLKKMQEDNPDLEYRFWEQKNEIERIEEGPTNQEILDAIQNINNKIDRIFGLHVLVDKKWEFINLG